MTHILTFVAANNDLNQDIIATAIADASPINWLANNKAAEIHTSKNLSINEIESLRKTIDSHKIDVFCTPLENRRKKLFMADMETTK